MKRFSKFLSLMLAAVLISATFAGVVSADIEYEDVEVVILLDVSGSMNNVDPESELGSRLSVLAIEQFASYAPGISNSNLYITIIPYNDKVYEEFDCVNVSSENGKESFKEQIKLVLADNRDNNVLQGIVTWGSMTNIGGALDCAAERLCGEDSNSSINKKAVILFTDGKIELASPDDEAASIEMAEDARDTLAEADIPIFSIGLNAVSNNGEDAVDIPFLCDISGEDKVEVVDSADQLLTAFADIYEFLYPGYIPEEPVTEPDLITLEGTDYDLHIFGDAVVEANYSITSTKRIYTISVIDPSGDVVASIDATDTENISGDCDTDRCVIDFDVCGVSATVKLLEPSDGDWRIRITGEESAAVTRRVCIYRMMVMSDISKDGAYVGAPFKFSANLYDYENEEDLTNKSLYSKDEGANASVIVTPAGSDNSKEYKGTLNSSGVAFDFEVDFDMPGKYDLTIALTHPGYIGMVKTYTVDVYGPELSLEAVAKTDGGLNPDIIISFVNPITGEAADSVPAYLDSVDINITAFDGDEECGTDSVSAELFENGKYRLQPIELPIGEYDFIADFKYGDETTVSNRISVEYLASVITQTGSFISKIDKSGLSADLSYSTSLEGKFKDSDGDAVSYSVSVSENAPFKATVEGDTLKINATGFGKGTVSLLVTDNNGATYTHNIKVEMISLMPLMITIAVIVLIVIIALIVFLIIVSRQKIPQIGFKVCFENSDPSDFYGSKKAVYTVARLSSKKSAKSNMTLSNILGTSSYATMDPSPTLAPEIISQIMTTYCPKITVCGVPFAKQLKFTYKESDKKSKTYTFKKSNISIKVSDTATIVIGNRNAAL